MSGCLFPTPHASQEPIQNEPPKEKQVGNELNLVFLFYGEEIMTPSEILCWCKKMSERKTRKSKKGGLEFFYIARNKSMFVEILAKGYFFLSKDHMTKERCRVWMNFFPSSPHSSWYYNVEMGAYFNDD